VIPLLILLAVLSPLVVATLWVVYGPQKGSRP
jgi:hypothetical protein